MAITNLIFTVGGSGGVGKSYTLTQIAVALQTMNIPFEAYESDRENVDKPGSFAHVIKNVTRLPLRDALQLDKMLEGLAKKRGKIALWDLGAGASEDIGRWIHLITKEDLQAMGIKLIAVGVVARHAGAVESVCRWAEFLGSRADFAVAINKRGVEPVLEESRHLEELFPDYYRNAGAQKFRKLFKPVEFEIPALDIDVACELADCGMTIPQVLVTDKDVGRRLNLTGGLMKLRLRDYHQRTVQNIRALQLLLDGVQFDAPVGE